MKTPPVIALALVFLSCLSFAGNELRLEIRGLRNSKGNVLASLFDSKDGFPGDHTKSFQSHVAGAVTNSLSLVFTNVPAGTYAVAVCHDENADGKMNRRMFGPPVEGWAVYRQQKPRLGPPKYEESAFQVSAGDTSIVVTVVYPGG